jgi:intracellular multiplication protein IcmD
MNKKKLGKALTLGLVLFMGSVEVFAAGSSGGGSPPSGSIGALADTIIQSLQSVQDMLIAICYIAGVGFAGAGIFKFKQHKDNPTQVPLGGPIAMIFIAAALIYLPSVIVATGSTIFGTSGQHGSIGQNQNIFEGSGGS